MTKITASRLYDYLQCKHKIWWGLWGLREMKIVLPLVVILLASLGVNIWQWQKSQNQNMVEVARVIDGDTFETSSQQTVRIYGIEAPEITACGGAEAKKELEKYILGKKVHWNVRVRDSYERLVAEVYTDNSYIADQMVSSGWALYKSVNPADKESLKIHGQEARNKKLGIFGEKCTQMVNLSMRDCSIKGNVNTQNGEKIYHFSSCGRYEEFPVELWRGNRWFCMEKEAEKAGFTKSKNCFGRSF